MSSGRSKRRTPEGDERFWDAMRDIGASSVEGHKALISRAETRIAEQAAKAAEAGEQAHVAKDLDVRAALKAAGFTERDLRRMRLLASLTEAEMQQASAKAGAESARRIGPPSARPVGS